MRMRHYNHLISACNKKIFCVVTKLLQSAFVCLCRALSIICDSPVCHFTINECTAFGWDPGSRPGFSRASTRTQGTLVIFCCKYMIYISTILDRRSSNLFLVRKYKVTWSDNFEIIENSRSSQKSLENLAAEKLTISRKV